MNKSPRKAVEERSQLCNKLIKTEIEEGKIVYKAE